MDFYVKNTEAHYNRLICSMICLNYVIINYTSMTYKFIIEILTEGRESQGDVTSEWFQDCGSKKPESFESKSNFIKSIGSISLKISIK